MLSTKINEKKTLTEALKQNFDGLFKLDYQSFIDAIHEYIPESFLMQGKANVSAEGNAIDKPKNNFFGLTEDEEIRAFSGLLRFKDVISGTEADYNNFVACQIEMKKPVLSFSSFQKMREYVTTTLKSPEEYAAIMWSILCNDLGKVQSVIDTYEKLPNKRHIGHDQLLAQMLEQTTLFSAFNQLDATLRPQIIAGYASGCDISMLEQLELPPVSMRALEQLDKRSLDLYIMHAIFDVAGAAAHFKSNGSLTLHEETWAFFNALRIGLENLHKNEGHTIEEVYADYLSYRGDCVGIPANSPEHCALIRIAGLARLATPAQGKMLLSVWDNLAQEAKDILTTELNLHGGLGKRAIFIGYGVAMLLNPQGALQKELTEAGKVLGVQISPEQRSAATQEGMKIGLTIMAKAFAKTREIIGNDATAAIFVAECDEIARSLNKDPRKALNQDFAITKQSDRRIDFTFSPALAPAVQKEDPVALPKQAATIKSTATLFSAASVNAPVSTTTPAQTYQKTL